MEKVSQGMLRWLHHGEDEWWWFHERSILRAGLKQRVSVKEWTSTGRKLGRWGTGYAMRVWQNRISWRCFYHGYPLRKFPWRKQGTGYIDKWKTYKYTGRKTRGKNLEKMQLDTMRLYKYKMVNSREPACARAREKIRKIIEFTLQGCVCDRERGTDRQRGRKRGGDWSQRRRTPSRPEAHLPRGSVPRCVSSTPLQSPPPWPTPTPAGDHTSECSSSAPQMLSVEDNCNWRAFIIWL